MSLASLNPDGPVEYAGVVLSVDAYGKHTAHRIYILGDEVTLVPVSAGRSLGAAGKVAASEMEIVAHLIPRGKIKLLAPPKAALKVDQ